MDVRTPFVGTTIQSLIAEKLHYGCLPKLAAAWRAFRLLSDGDVFVMSRQAEQIRWENKKSCRAVR